jgi:DeoR family fructose operon transcriptional repressor
MLKAERQQKIVDQVLHDGTMTVSELSAQFDVSEITIRRDLDELDALGYLERVRGGVRRPSPRGPEPPVVQRQKTNVVEKKAIAYAAMELISDGDVIGLHMGTTTLELARVLAGQPWVDLKVVTNGIPIMSELARVPGIQLICVGGVVDVNELATNGYHAEEFLSRLNLSKLFLGCRGIDTEQGITNTIQSEKELGIIQSFVEIASRVIVLADHSKFNQVFSMQVLPLSAIEMVITDLQTPDSVLDTIAGYGIQIVQSPHPLDAD